MGHELELKFRATPEELEAIRAAYPGDYTPIRMETIYYDTPDRALSARHWTLRCRRENDTYVCTLKTPAGGWGRGEWEVEHPDLAAALPILAVESGLRELTELTREGIVPTCGAKFLRLARTLDLDGTAVELALDRGILTGGGRELPFAEAELELKSGDANTLLAFGSVFAGEFALEPEPRSKFARARALNQEDRHGI